MASTNTQIVANRDTSSSLASGIKEKGLKIINSGTLYVGGCVAEVVLDRFEAEVDA